MPRFDESACVHCGKCAKACPVDAIIVDAEQKVLSLQPTRCIGCGLCSLACDKQKAVTMGPVPDYRRPFRNLFSMVMGSAPNMLRTSLKIWRNR